MQWTTSGVTAWAESAWEAWSAHWDQARVWVQEALDDYQR